MKSLLTISSIVLLTSYILSAQRTPPMTKPANLGDTTYLPAAKIPLQALVSLDSITQFIVPEIGRTMTVSEANEYKKFYFRQIDRVRNSMLMDSIAVPSQKPNSKQGK